MIKGPERFGESQPDLPEVSEQPLQDQPEAPAPGAASTHEESAVPLNTSGGALHDHDDRPDTSRATQPVRPAPLRSYFDSPPKR